MKKFGLLLAGVLSASILLATIGPMVALLVGLALLYFLYKQFIKAGSSAAKIGLGIIGVMVILVNLHNIPALIGLGAAYVLYLVYKKWNEDKRSSYVKKETDPFANFEKQWNEIIK